MVNALANDSDDSSAEDFDSGFGAGPTDTPGEPLMTEGKDAAELAEPTAPQYAQITVDDLAALKASAARSDELRATLEKVQGTAFGKIGGIERQLKELSAASSPDISQDAIDQFREDGFEPLAQALEQLKGIRVLGGGQAIDTEALLSQAEQRFEMKQLARQHPDWQQIDADPAFAAFMAALPADRQQALGKASADYDSAVVGAEMAAFKADRTAKAAKAATQARQDQPDPASVRRSRMSAAVTPRGPGNEPGANNPQADFDAGFKAR